MQNDYLNNKKNFDRSKKEKVVKKNLFNLDPKTNKNVDINKLLNRVKMDEKNKKKENWILLTLFALSIGIMGIIIIL